MRKLTLLLPFAALIGYLGLTSYSSGIPGMNASTQGCAQNSSCHGGAQNSATALTIIGMPASGWTSGTTYALTATVSNSAQARGGFNITANVGTLSNAGTGALITAGELHHTAPKIFTSGSASWTFSWTAPASSSTATSVDFNFAGNAVNNNGNSSGDVWNKTTINFLKAAAAPSAPTLSVSGSTTPCAGQPFPTLTASAAGATAYQWYNGATNVATGTTYTPTASGTYSATASNSAGTSSASSPISVTVTPLPSAVFTKTNTTGNTWTFSYPTAGLTYLWTFGEGTATSTAQNPTYTYTTPGVKTVKLRVTTGNGICRDSTTQTLTVTTAIKDIPALAGFRYGPNPASASLLLHTGALKADVRLLDLTGKVIANLRTRAETTSEKTVSLAQLAAGLYFLEVTTDEARGVEKLLIR